MWATKRHMAEVMERKLTELGEILTDDVWQTLNRTGFGRKVLDLTPAVERAAVACGCRQTPRRQITDAQVLVRARLRRPYRQKPDLPGMTKRKRRFGYPDWFPRYGYHQCLIRQKPRFDPDVDPEPQRELKPRPPYRRNRKAYDRGRERAEFAAILGSL